MPNLPTRPICAAPTRVDDILDDLKQAKNLRILVLDSCRDNPLADQLKRSIGTTRSATIQRGLAKIESPDGTIISYSTQAGRTAADGDGRNSPYTTAFLKHIEEKDDISAVFHHISADVYSTAAAARCRNCRCRSSASSISTASCRSRSRRASRRRRRLRRRRRALEEHGGRRQRSGVRGSSRALSQLRLCRPGASPDRRSQEQGQGEEERGRARLLEFDQGQRRRRHVPRLSRRAFRTACSLHSRANVSPH